MRLLERFVNRTDFVDYEDFNNNLHITTPKNFNFAYDVMDVYAQLEPDKRALVWCDDRGGERTFTFDELRRLSNKAANVFLKAGIGKGDRVLLILMRRWEFWVTVLALHKIGAVAVPGSHMLTGRDLVYRNNAAQIKMTLSVADESVMGHVDDSYDQSPTLETRACIGGSRDGWMDFDLEMGLASDEFEKPVDYPCDVNDLILFFTSGTTGMPKMVLHDHNYPLGHILTAAFWQNIQDNGLHFTVADSGWAKTMWGKFYGQWICGSAVFVYDYHNKFDSIHMLEMIEKHQITSFCGPATVYRMMLRENYIQYNLSSLKHLCVAGEPLYPEVFKIVKDSLGLMLMEGFGQSETAVAVANFPWMQPKPGSMGKPSPGYDVRLIDDEGNACAPYEHGHIVFKRHEADPPGMFRGYLTPQGILQSPWCDGYYFTGDVAYLDEDGHYWYVGRSDDTIKSSGYKIGPFEVESALQEHPAVRECMVRGVPDPVRGQVVKATITLHTGYEESDELVVELQEHVKNITAPYKYPRVIEFVPEMPRTASGKIHRCLVKAAD